MWGGKCTATADMTIFIFTYIGTCYDMFDIMIIPFSALELIIGRYINEAYYYY